MKKQYIFILVGILLSGISLPAAGVDIHGLLSQGYMFSTDNNYFAKTSEGTFQFNELAINFSSKLTPRLRIGLQFFARDLGELGNDEVTLDWVVADYRWREWIGLRAGKIKNPIGLYNEVRDIDMVRTFINLPQSVYQERYRDSWIAMNGGGLYGKINSHMMGTLGYQFQLGSIEADEDSGAAKHFESLTSGFKPTEALDIGLTYCGKIEWWTPNVPLRLAASTLIYDFTVHAESRILSDLTMDGSIDDFRVTVGSVEYIWKDLVLVFEYSEIYTRSTFVFSPPPFDALSIYDMKMPMQGYYGSIAYRFFDWFELGAYYSIYYPDKNDKDGEKLVEMFKIDDNIIPGIEAMIESLGYPTDAMAKQKFQAWSKDACLSARFDLNDSWIFKLEAHLMNGAADLFEMDNLDKRGIPDLEEDWMLFAAKVSYTF